MEQLFYIHGATMPDGTAKEYYRLGEPFILGEVQYPTGWISPIEGATEVEFGERPDQGWYDVEEVFNGPSITYRASPKPLEVVRAKKYADLAAKRFVVEVSGCVMNGQTVLTDRDTQAKVTGAFTAVSNGLPAPLTWKTPAGFVTLTTDQIKALALGIAAHVQAAFTNEGRHVAAIEALANPQAVIDYDFSAGWPENPEVL